MPRVTLENTLFNGSLFDKFETATRFVAFKQIQSSIGFWFWVPDRSTQKWDTIKIGHLSQKTWFYAKQRQTYAYYISNRILWNDELFGNIFRFGQCLTTLELTIKATGNSSTLSKNIVSPVISGTKMTSMLWRCKKSPSLPEKAIGMARNWLKVP